MSVDHDMITFEDLSEPLPYDAGELAERRAAVVRSLPPDFGFQIELRMMAQAWDESGVVILPAFLSDAFVDAYCARWLRDNKSWRKNTPFMEVEELRDLALQPKLMSILAYLIGSEMALNLCLHEWTSTERNVHQDDYLNPPCVRNRYAAVWFALDDIHPDSGPFEYWPGTHKWPIMRQERLLACYPPEMRFNPAWPSLTEPLVVRTIEDRLRAEGLKSEFFHARKGDALIWNGGLVHRGSYPKRRGMERRALIAHYSSIEHRLDMPRTLQHKNMGGYFDL